MKNRTVINIRNLDLLSAAIDALASYISIDSTALRNEVDERFVVISAHLDNLAKLIGEESNSEFVFDLIQAPKQLQLTIQTTLDGIFERVATALERTRPADDFTQKIDTLSSDDCRQAKISLNIIREQVAEICAYCRIRRDSYALTGNY